MFASSSILLNPLLKFFNHSFGSLLSHSKLGSSVQLGIIDFIRLISPFSFRCSTSQFLNVLHEASFSTSVCQVFLSFLGFTPISTNTHSLCSNKSVGVGYVEGVKYGMSRFMLSSSVFIRFLSTPLKLRCLGFTSSLSPL